MLGAGVGDPSPGAGLTDCSRDTTAKVSTLSLGTGALEVGLPTVLGLPDLAAASVDGGLLVVVWLPGKGLAVPSAESDMGLTVVSLGSVFCLLSSKAS